MNDPQIQYVRSRDGVSIAYWTMGEGVPFLSLQSAPSSDIQHEWHEWELHRLVARNRRLVRYDLRGHGLSSRGIEDFSLDALVADLEAVVDDLDLDTFALSGEFNTTATALAYAERHRERVSHLVLTNAYASGKRMAAVPRMRAVLSLLLDHGQWDLFCDVFSHAWFGWEGWSASRDMSAFIQRATTPAEARRFLLAHHETDVSDLLPRITAPTLVVAARGPDFPPVEFAREIASGIPNARMITIASASAWTDEFTEGLLIALDEFIGDGDRASLAERLRRPSPTTMPQGLVTILFTDIEGSTALTAEIGDAAAREIVREHERLTREMLRANGGAEVKTTGDGVMAMFTSASRAVECSIAIQRAIERWNSDRAAPPLRVRIGLNAGEPLADESDLHGSAVNMAARIVAEAAGGEIVVSNVVRELCALHGIAFADRGETPLRGFDDPVRLFEVHWAE